jgi:hypothetical protein
VWIGSDDPILTICVYVLVDDVEVDESEIESILCQLMGKGITAAKIMENRSQIADIWS